MAEATLPASQLRYAGFSPDGKEVRVGTNQGKFQRLTATKLALIGQAESVPPFGVASAAVTRDHTLLAVGSWRGDILLSDSQTDEIKVQLPVQFDLDQTAVTAIVLAEDARKCVVGNRSSKVRMYRVDPPELVWESAPLDQEISGVDLSGDGAHVVVSTGVLNDYRSPGKIVALDAANGKVRHSWTDTTSKVNHVAIAGDSRSLLAADNAALRVYDLVTGQLLHTHPALSGVQRIKFIDATHCAISLFPGRLAIWHLPSKRVVLHYTGHKPGADRTIAQLIWALDVSPDKQKLLSADTTGQVYLWPIPAKLLAPTP